MENNKLNSLKINISSTVYKDKMPTQSAVPSNNNTNNQKESTPAVTGINSIEKLKRNYKM